MLVHHSPGKATVRSGHAHRPGTRAGLGSWVKSSRSHSPWLVGCLACWAWVASAWTARAADDRAPAPIIDPGEESLPGSDPDLFADFALPDTSLPVLDWSKAWPPRLGEEANAGRKGAAMVVRNGGPGMPRLARSRAFLPEIEQERDDALAQLVAVQQLNAGDGARARLLRPNALVGLPPLPERRARTQDDPAWVARFVSAQREAGVLELQTTWFAYLPPEGSTKPRGVALFMPGLLGTPEGVIVQLAQQLRSRGVGVLRMMAQPSRFTEAITFDLDPTDPAGSAARVAAVLQDRSAEVAYSAEAAWGLLEQESPEVAQLPRAVIGLSAGAMTLPIVVARQPDAYAAALPIAGGAQYWQMTQTSNYNAWIGAVRVAWSAPPTPAQLAASFREYERVAPLDALHTAAALRSVRTLVLQGNADRAVPSPLGDALWERAGKPERWVFPVGHEMLFLQLHTQFDAIVAWLERALAPQAAPLGTESQGGGTP